MRVVEEAILSTDLALYCKKKDLFETIVNEGEIDWQEQDKKQRECMRQLIGVTKFKIVRLVEERPKVKRTETLFVTALCNPLFLGSSTLFLRILIQSSEQQKNTTVLHRRRNILPSFLLCVLSIAMFCSSIKDLSLFSPRQII